MTMIPAAVENGGGDNGGGGYEVEGKFSYSSLVNSREALAQNSMELSGCEGMKACRLRKSECQEG